jgi:hypothetical protein
MQRRCYFRSHPIGESSALLVDDSFGAGRVIEVAAGLGRLSLSFRPTPDGATLAVRATYGRRSARRNGLLLSEEPPLATSAPAVLAPFSARRWRASLVSGNPRSPGICGSWKTRSECRCSAGRRGASPSPTKAAAFMKGHAPYLFFTRAARAKTHCMPLAGLFLLSAETQ